MASVISNVRQLIGDDYADGNAAQTFTDQKVQDVLDQYVTRYALVPMRYEVSITNGSTFQWLTYLTPDGLGNWEDTALLQNASYVTLTPATSDLIAGVWTLSASTVPPVYLSGRNYDVYASAAIMCRQWAAKVKLHFDATDSGVSMQRHQKYDMLIALCKEYEAKRRAHGIRMKRHDLGRPQLGQQEDWTNRDAYKTPRTPPNP
jgi:hypothetical protein